MVRCLRKVNDTVLFVDGDIVAHKAVSANFSDIEWEPGLWTYHTDFYGAQAAFNKFVAGLRDKAEADKVVVAITGPGTFRYNLWPTYKGHRKPKPPGYRAFQDWIREESGFETFLHPNIEADDCLGILMTNPKLYPGAFKVLWSIDKDLRQIPGTHLIEAAFEDITAEQGARFHAYQTLVGDVTDNYPGCPGIGPAKAEKLLAGPRETWWPAVAAAFEKAGNSREEMLVQARLARILQHGDYDYSKKEPILWSPPS